MRNTIKKKKYSQSSSGNALENLEELELNQNPDCFNNKLLPEKLVDDNPFIESSNPLKNTIINDDLCIKRRSKIEGEKDKEKGKGKNPIDLFSNLSPLISNMNTSPLKKNSMMVNINRN